MIGNFDFGPRESWRVLVGPGRSGFPAAPLGPTGSYQELDEFGIRTYGELTPGRWEIRGTLWKASLPLLVSVELGRVGAP